jgi:small subunit ribosomal protein S16
MPVKIRLQRRGRKKRPFYQIVVADVRAPRDGKYIERIGSYNPMTKPATIEIDRDKAYDWLLKGAQPTDTVRAILRFKGVYYKKHLMRGVKKGALSIEDAEKKYQEWVDAKEEKIAKRFAQSAAEKAAFQAQVAGISLAEEHRLSGTDKEQIAEQAAAVAEAQVEETATETVEAVAEVVEKPKAEVAAEAEAPEAVEETPATEEEKAPSQEEE